MRVIDISRCLILSTAVTWFATACTTVEPIEAPPEPAPVEIDPAIYALSGLLTAEETIENRTRELLDAGSTGLRTDEIDDFLNRLESRLRAALTDTTLTVYQIRDYVSVRMPVQSIFSMSSADLDPAAFAALTSVSTILNEFQQTMIEIASHTDGRGSTDYNQELSSRRVTSLVSFLQARDVDPLRVIEAPAGAAHPVDDDGSAAGRELNRRVELTLVPIRAPEPEPIVTDGSDL